MNFSYAFFFFFWRTLKDVFGRILNLNVSLPDFILSLFKSSHIEWIPCLKIRYIRGLFGPFGMHKIVLSLRGNILMHLFGGIAGNRLTFGMMYNSQEYLLIFGPSKW